MKWSRLLRDLELFRGLEGIEGNIGVYRFMAPFN